jgi:hypothetical protein
MSAFFDTGTLRRQVIGTVADSDPAYGVVLVRYAELGAERLQVFGHEAMVGARARAGAGVAGHAAVREGPRNARADLTPHQ